MGQDRLCIRCFVRLFYVWIWLGGRGPYCSACSRLLQFGPDTVTVETGR